MSISQSDIDNLIGGTAVAPKPADTAVTTPPRPLVPPVTTVREPPDIKRILGLKVQVSAVLAQRVMQIEEILEITTGSIIEFDVLFDSELTLSVAGHPIGTGHAVKVGENFGIRMNRIGTLNERIDAMGGGG